MKTLDEQEREAYITNNKPVLQMLETTENEHSDFVVEQENDFMDEIKSLQDEIEALQKALDRAEAENIELRAKIDAAALSIEEALDRLTA